MDMLPTPKTATLENRTFDEIKAGDSASIIRTLTEADIELFAIVSGDVNPAHLDPVYAKTDLFHRVVAHGMWGGGLISAVLGTKLPGPGTIYLSQSLRFLAPIGIGDTITTTVTAREKQIERHRITFDCRCVNQAGHEVITGVAEVRAPVEQLRQDRMELPDVQLARHRRFRDLLALATGHPPVPVAVAYPCDALSLGGVVEVADLGLVVPILVGPTTKIHAAAAEAKVDIGTFRLIDEPDAEAAALRAVALVRAGEAALLMKGSLHTDVLMHAVVAAGTGLRTARRLSHVFLMDVPSYPTSAADHRRRDQHRPDVGGKARHCAKRDRSGACHGHHDTARGDPGGGRDCQPSDAFHARCRRAVQDGGSRADHRRPAGGAAGVRQRGQRGRGAGEGHHLARRRARRHPGGAGSRGRQYAGEATVLPGRCRRGRRRGRRARADHPDQPGGLARAPGSRPAPSRC